MRIWCDVSISHVHSGHIGWSISQRMYIISQEILTRSSDRRRPSMSDSETTGYESGETCTVGRMWWGCRRCANSELYLDHGTLAGNICIITSCDSIHEYFHPGESFTQIDPQRTVPLHVRRFVGNEINIHMVADIDRSRSMKWLRDDRHRAISIDTMCSLERCDGIYTSS